ncbi:MAG: hypothetical protein JKX76_01090 [Colwellia sp.]|nr:hypothetical protein [Colwellia sp.]
MNIVQFSYGIIIHRAKTIECLSSKYDIRHFLLKWTELTTSTSCRSLRSSILKSVDNLLIQSIRYGYIDILEWGESQTPKLLPNRRMLSNVLRNHKEYKHRILGGRQINVPWKNNKYTVTINILKWCSTRPFYKNPFGTSIKFSETTERRLSNTKSPLSFWQSHTTWMSEDLFSDFYSGVHLFGGPILPSQDFFDQLLNNDDLNYKLTVLDFLKKLPYYTSPNNSKIGGPIIPSIEQLNDFCIHGKCGEVQVLDSLKDFIVPSIAIVQYCTKFDKLDVLLWMRENVKDGREKIPSLDLMRIAVKHNHLSILEWALKYVNPDILCFNAAKLNGNKKIKRWCSDNMKNK